jgi:hypothetical protein
MAAPNFKKVKPTTRNAAHIYVCGMDLETYDTINYALEIFLVDFNISNTKI